MNIDTLRWVIAGCGILLVAGIYLWDRLRRKAKDDAEIEARPDSSEEDFPLHADLIDLDEDIELPSIRGERFDAPADDPLDEPDEPETGNAEIEDSDDTADPFGIVQVKVTAHEGMCFSGTLLIKALKSSGLEYGSMKIFHKLPAGIQMPLFSVVNMVEPGTFPVDDPSHFESPGVVFFLQLAASEKPVEAFDEMVRTADVLAARIGGEVLDEANELLTIERAEKIRDSLASIAARRD